MEQWGWVVYPGAVLLVSLVAGIRAKGNLATKIFTGALAGIFWPVMMVLWLGFLCIWILALPLLAINRVRNGSWEMTIDFNKKDRGRA